MVKIWVAAGIINLLTAFIHLIGGHFDPILPFVSSDLAVIPKATLHAVWHMVTVMLFFSSSVLLYIGIKPNKYASKQIAALLGALYVLFSIVFIVVNIGYGFFKLPQWVLLFPVGVLSLYGARKA